MNQDLVVPDLRDGQRFDGERLQAAEVIDGDALHLLCRCRTHFVLLKHAACFRANYLSTTINLQSSLNGRPRNSGVSNFDQLSPPSLERNTSSPYRNDGL